MQNPDEPCRRIQNVPMPHHRSATALLHHLEQVTCQHYPFILSAERISYPGADVTMLKVRSRIGCNKESTMLLQESDLLQGRSTMVMVCVMKRRWNNKKRETKALSRTLSLNLCGQLSNKDLFEDKIHWLDILVGFLIMVWVSLCYWVVLHK